MRLTLGMNATLPAPNQATIDAAGESVAYVGQIFLSTGHGTSATLNSSCSISYLNGPSAPTFANTSTVVRVGVQDVATNGIEDGEWDVYGEITGGSGLIVDDKITTVAMTNGTKTITHGDRIAIVIELMSVGGTDNIKPGYSPTSLAVNPHITVDNAGTNTPTKSSASPNGMINFTDGVFGHFGEQTVPIELKQNSFSSSSTPDEYAIIFQLPFDATITRLIGAVGEVDLTEDAELILYTDPLGTPTTNSQMTIAVSAAECGYTATGSGYMDFELSVPFQASKNTTYAIAYRPTTTGLRTLITKVLPTADVRTLSIFGNTVYGGVRTNQTGAFTTSTTEIADLGCIISHIGVQ